MGITNVLFSGVGGQGIILASKILTKCAFVSGYMVKESELHGMAQRGGSVTSHVRFGEEVYSPLIHKGRADFMVALGRVGRLEICLLSQTGRKGNPQPEKNSAFFHQSCCCSISGRRKIPIGVYGFSRGQRQRSRNCNQLWEIPRLKISL